MSYKRLHKRILDNLAQYPYSVNSKYKPEAKTVNNNCTAIYIETVKRSNPQRIKIKKKN